MERKLTDVVIGYLSMNSSNVCVVVWLLKCWKASLEDECILAKVTL